MIATLTRRAAGWVIVAAPARPDSHHPDAHRPATAHPDPAHPDTAHPDPGRTAYRPDIDGLRAVAVLSVLLFHAGISRFNGGYVGVDIFFVISGYLISQVIRQEVAERRFSVARFYERRFRRIFPAFIAAVTFTSVLSYLYLMPDNLRGYVPSLAATLFSVSNIYFWQHSSYFDLPSASQPLLQTWSLAIEEQFYLVLPPLLLLLHRWVPRRVGTVLAGVAALSLVVSGLSILTHPETTFYLLHTRAWELLTGSLIAYGMVPEARSALLRNILTMLGLGLILYAIFFFTTTMPFPGPAALVPCLGTALIIAAGRSGPSLAGRALSLRPVVFVGLISYSLYLWHWPVVVFQNSDSFLIAGSPRTGKLAIIVVALVLGTLSWWLVERPFRRAAFLTRRQVFSAAGAAAAFVLAQAGLLSVLPPRFAPEVAAMAAYAADPATHFRGGVCFISNANHLAGFDPAACLRQTPGRPSILLLGDSQAAHLWYGMDQVFTGADVLQATAAGCVPTLSDAAGYTECSRLMHQILDTWLATHKVDALVLSARWSPGDMPHVAATLDWARARGIHVVLLGRILEYDSTLPRLLALALDRHDPGLPARHHLDDTDLDGPMAAMAARDGTPFISLQHLLCPAGTCQTTAPDGTPMQFDYSHLTRAGSVEVARKLQATGLLP